MCVCMCMCIYKLIFLHSLILNIKIFYVFYIGHGNFSFLSESQPGKVI